jgi:hypothetical protein
MLSAVEQVNLRRLTEMPIIHEQFCSTSQVNLEPPCETWLDNSWVDISLNLARVSMDVNGAAQVSSRI